LAASLCNHPSDINPPNPSGKDSFSGRYGATATGFSGPQNNSVQATLLRFVLEDTYHFAEIRIEYFTRKDGGEVSRRSILYGGMLWLRVLISVSGAQSHVF
jgi:hypothetical protein